MLRPPALAVLLSLAAQPLAGQGARSYTLSGDRVAVYNLAGEITVRGGTGSAVTATVTPMGADPGRLTVETGVLRGSETLRILYPSDRIVYPALGRGSSTTLTTREDGTWGDEGEYRRTREERGGRRVTIRGDGSGLEASADLTITVPTGKKVAVYLGVGTLEVANVDGDLKLSASSADVSARQSRGSLSIETGSGDIRASDLDGQVTLDTGSGDVTLSGQKNGKLNIDTGSGSVTGSNLDTPELRVDTGSGDIRLDAVRAPRLDLETGSGSVRADLAGALESVSVETGSGDVSLRLPQGIGATVELDTGSGSFEVALPVELLRKDQGNLRGKIGDGRARVHIETGSGDIALLK
jgi:hypothetical protein